MKSKQFKQKLKKINILTQYDLEILICYFCAEEW